MSKQQFLMMNVNDFDDNELDHIDYDNIPLSDELNNDDIHANFSVSIIEIV